MQRLRPVGNVIDTNISNIENTFLSPFATSFYNSGTAALAAAVIAARKLKSTIDRPEVIVPAYGCPDLISAIIFAGAVPTLVDLEKNSPLISLNKIRDAINDKTIAIIAVRFLGVNEQFRNLSSIAKAYNLILIEDSAQGFPLTNIESYWHGDFVILSFGRGKPINLLGGGAVLTRKHHFKEALPVPSDTHKSIIDNIKYKIKLYIYNKSIKPTTYGLITKLPGLHIGQTIFTPLEAIQNIDNNNKSLLNSNIKAYQTQINCQLKYKEMFKHTDNDLLIDLPQSLSHDMTYPLLRYPILIQDKLKRDHVYNKLKPYGASIMYKKPLYKIDGIKNIVKPIDNSYSNASCFSQQLLTLPTHEGVCDRTLDIIQHVINEG